MKNNFFNYFRSSTLVITIALFAIALYLAKTHWQLSIAITGIITTILVLIAKYTWNIWPFKYLFWIDDFSGRYEGTLRFQYIDEAGILQTGERKHVKIINQNGSRISVSSFTLKKDGEKSSPSYSKGIFIEPTEDQQHFQIVYHYLNNGNEQLGFMPHFGTDVIKFIKKGDAKVLSGGYYTNRNPQTRGEYIDLKWVSKELSHEF